MFGHDRRVRTRGRAAQPSDHLPCLAKALIPAVRDRDIDGDPVKPGLYGRIGPPAGPISIGALVGLLGAVLGGRDVAHEGDQRAEYAAVRVSVEPFEVGFRTGLVPLWRGRLRHLPFLWP